MRFGEQLAEKDVRLVLVPIPVKPMIYPEHVGGRKTEGKALRHRDSESFYGELREGGVEVLDLAQDFVEFKESGTQVFLKQDTHWTPEAMEEAARVVAMSVGKSLSTRRNAEPVHPDAAGGENLGSLQISRLGDLVEKLDLPRAVHGFLEEEEEVEVHPIPEADVFDEDSPVVLLGDSFSNIYHSAQLGWGEKAGFPEHLSRELGMPIDTIAQNGQASTGVRKTLASRPGALDGKNVVIWAIAARDLFLSETVARETSVEWHDVEFNPAPKVSRQPLTGDLVVEAEMVARSAIENPKSVSYPDGLYVAKYRVDDFVAGNWHESEIFVIHWAFRQKELLPESKFQVGDRKLMSLVPFHEVEKLKGLNVSDTLGEFMPDTFWAEEIRPVD